MRIKPPAHIARQSKRACQLGRESRNAEVIVHVVRWGGSSECSESTTNARGERNDNARYGERNKYTISP